MQSCGVGGGSIGFRAWIPYLQRCAIFAGDEIQQAPFFCSPPPCGGRSFAEVMKSQAGLLVASVLTRQVVQYSAISPPGSSHTNVASLSRPYLCIEN